jgi:hypothetical protein
VLSHLQLGEKKANFSSLFNCQLLEQEERTFNSCFLRRRDFASKIEVSKRRYLKCKSGERESVNPRTLMQHAMPYRSKRVKQRVKLHDLPRAP